MSDREQARHEITRRTFVRTAIGSLITLPAVGGVGLFSMGRVAYAAGIQEKAGQTFTNEQLAKITVVTKTEASIVVVDVANYKDMNDAVDARAFVQGAHVKLTSRYNKKSVEAVTDEEGKVIFDIKELSENPNHKPLDQLLSYEFNGTIEITREGFRTFKTALIRVMGADVIVAPTRSITPNDSSAYPHMVSFNEWDVLYFHNEFVTSDGNKIDQTLAMEGHGFGNEQATVVLREQGTETELMSTTVTPKNGVVQASFTHKFSLLGGEKSLQVGKSYELMVVQGDLAYLWPLQLSMREGVLSEAVDTTLDYQPFSFRGGESFNAVITWPESLPFFGGSKTDILAPFKNTVNAYFDPFGFAQLTATFPIYGYKKDNCDRHPDGWGQYPYQSVTKQIQTWKDDLQGTLDAVSESYSNEGKYGFRQAELFLSFKMMITFQMMCALQWDDPTHLMRGASSYRGNLTLDFTLAEQFWFGPVPVVIVLNLPFSATAAFTMGIHTEPTDPGEALYKQLFDFGSWKKAPSDDNITLTFTFGPSLSVGVGVRGVASVSIKGKFVLTFAIIFPMDTDNPALKGKPPIHLVVGYTASIQVVLQIFFGSQTWTLAEKKDPTWQDNWKGKTSPAEDPNYMKPAAEDNLPTLEEFINGVTLITSGMMQKTSENSGITAASEETAGGAGSSGAGTMAAQANVSRASAFKEKWEKARKIAKEAHLDKEAKVGGVTVDHRFYRFTRKPPVTQVSGTSTQSQGAAGTTSAPLVEPTSAGRTVPAAMAFAPKTTKLTEKTIELDADTITSGNEIAELGTESLPANKPTAAGNATSGEGEAPMEELSGGSQGAANDQGKTDQGQSADQNKSAEQNKAADQDKTDPKAAEASGVSICNNGTSVRYPDWMAYTSAGPAPSADKAAPVVGEQIVAQASDGFLPDPGVDNVMNTGGIRPSSDKVIANPIYGDPHIKVLNIRTSMTGSSLSATCSFRIGTVNVEGVGMRSRIIMTVLYADAELALPAGTMRVIDFDITDADVLHADLFDYEFGMAFSSVSGSTGGVEMSIDQVEFVVVSGKREDTSSMVDVATDLYFTYLSFYSSDLFGDDLATASYLQLTLPADQIMNADANGHPIPDGLFHSISNVQCVSAANPDGTTGSLLVTFLDRASSAKDAVFSEDPSAVVVRPRFLLFRSDSINVDVAIPNSTAFDELLGRLNRNDPTAMRLTLSPKIGGFYTLSIQARNNTYFYLLEFDAERGVFTNAMQCPMLDSTLELVPWEEQDCFLTSFASAEYRATPEFLSGNRDTWDRSKWVLQKAWWKSTKSAANTYVLKFEEIGPESFNFSRFGINSSGTFIFWPEGRTGNDEYFYDVDGNPTVTGEDEAVYQIKTCRVRKYTDENGAERLHFSDPFVAADVPHGMDSLEAVATHNRYAPFEVLTTELIDTGETAKDNTGTEQPLYYAARLWYTSVPNLQCATVTAAECTLPAVSAGRNALFDVTIRNDGNSFLSGCTLQMYLHDLEADDKGVAIRDADGNYIDHGVTPINDPMEVTFSAEILQDSNFDKRDENGNFVNQEPDFALPPGKSSVYRVSAHIPEEWAHVKYVSFNATNPVMAEGGGLAAMADDEEEDVFQSYSVVPGTYPVVVNRLGPEQTRSRRFMAELPISDPKSGIETYSDSPVTVTRLSGSGGTGGSGTGGGDTGSAGGSQGSATQGGTARSTLPRTADPTSSVLPAALGLAGAALAAYGKRRAQNERGEEETDEADE